ncbi:(2Fe-2S)-binding protein [Alteribacillus bidgolensis]|uniref:Sarcosine oxidase subunit alpha n=1 Tax=Alteribacillus bidgolensis TaxID=930129 RepID=A0A1G8JMS5_9BACI|nr:(2Fe-2S)-binding protein [Alteribacillus bidgolensis]SDI32373.1 sarcosine oxidase subunit alpha [Alteribacillus bidgolensis]
MRVKHHPVLKDLENQREVTIYFNDKAYKAYEGDTIASAMMAEGIKTLRHHEVSGKGRGIYCNIGHCFECRVQLNEKKVARACLTSVSEGMRIHSL